MPLAFLNFYSILFSFQPLCVQFYMFSFFNHKIGGWSRIDCQVPSHQNSAIGELLCCNCKHFFDTLKHTPPFNLPEYVISVPRSFLFFFVFLVLIFFIYISLSLFIQISKSQPTRFNNSYRIGSIHKCTLFVCLLITLF